MINLIDTYGLWGTAVHCDATEQWATGLKYQTTAAIAIGKEDDAVDGGITSPLPLVGDQSYHFNRSSGGTDSRLRHKEEHLQEAKEKCSSESQSWLSELFNSHDDPTGATEKLGKALHPLQDWVAHGDFGITTSGAIFVVHNHNSPQASLGSTTDRESAVDSAQYDSDGPDGRPAGAAMQTNRDGTEYALFHPGRGQIRFKKTQELTESALRDFLNHVKANAKPCGKCRKYFLKDNN
jgi:hypothetical protein